jgi:D-3-phosphoglycerate dehydrogenase
MARFRVLLTDYAWADVEIERRVLAAAEAELIVAPRGDEATLAELATRADGILTCWANVSRNVIDAAAGCRIIARLGIGLDNIDLAAATARGILVTNVPDYCLQEVAEHTLALILALGRKLGVFHHQTKSGRYQLQGQPPLRRLRGQTVGVVGLGNIGGRVAELAAAVGFRTLACSRRQKELPKGIPIEWLDLPDLLAASDFVTLHVPLNEQTRHMIRADTLRRMKPTAFLINTARGGLVDHAALAEALAQQRLAGAALDVHEPEPPVLTQPPWNNPRVIVTPHAAFASEESVAELRERASRQVAQCLLGEWPPHVVNAAALGRMA